MRHRHAQCILFQFMPFPWSKRDYKSRFILKSYIVTIPKKIISRSNEDQQTLDIRFGTYLRKVSRPTKYLRGTFNQI